MFVRYCRLYVYTDTMYLNTITYSYYICGLINIRYHKDTVENSSILAEYSKIDTIIHNIDYFKDEYMYTYNAGYLIIKQMSLNPVIIIRSGNLEISVFNNNIEKITQYDRLEYVELKIIYVDNDYALTDLIKKLTYVYNDDSIKKLILH